MKIVSFSPFGYEGALVNVEVDLRKGIPAIDMVGLADGAVKESRERMKSAITNSGYDFPPERVLISLSPADLKKEGAGFDLPIALGVLEAQEKLDEAENGGDSRNWDEPVLVMGELELNGKIRSVKAIQAACSTARQYGIHKCIVPMANQDEAREIDDMKVYGAEKLSDAWEAAKNPQLFTTKAEEGFRKMEDDFPEDTVTVEGVEFPLVESGTDFKDVRGQKSFVEALQVAAAGGHNVLAYGPPGCGKSLSMQRFPSLLPLLSREHRESVTRIYSIAGLLPNHVSQIKKRPFRIPHQTATIEGICGGGPRCSPGEISLAHNGVLFLDEAAEFRSSVLQMLRVPLESKSITLSRAGRSTVFPADFQLLMATNPCPCGNYGSSDRICLCSAKSVEQYWRKFSVPLLDRIDIRIAVEGHEDQEESTDSATLRIKIARAYRIQMARQGKLNGELTPSETALHCNLGEEVQEKLRLLTENQDISSRGIASILKLSRTIADMEESEQILESHIEKAWKLRNGGKDTISVPVLA